MFASRGWTAAEWSAPRDRLAARGWVDADGNATERSRDGRDEIEWRTDRLADAPWQALGPTRAQRLAELTGPLLGPAFGQRLAVPRQPGERQHGQLTLPSAILISRQCDPGWCCEAAGDLPVVCLAASVSLIQGGHEGRAGTRRSALSAAWFWPGQEGHNDGNS